MKFFRENVLGIAGLALATGVAATFVYDYFEIKPKATYFTPIVPPPPATIASAPVSSPAPPTPSFNCAAATWKSERLVCSSHVVAQMDRTMAAAYERARGKAGSQATALKNAQNNWLRKTRESCGDTPCLIRIYDARIRELEAFLP